MVHQQVIRPFDPLLLVIQAPCHPSPTAIGEPGEGAPGHAVRRPVLDTGLVMGIAHQQAGILAHVLAKMGADTQRGYIRPIARQKILQKDPGMRIDGTLKVAPFDVQEQAVTQQLCEPCHSSLVIGDIVLLLPGIKEILHPVGYVERIATPLALQPEPGSELGDDILPPFAESREILV